MYLCGKGIQSVGAGAYEIILVSNLTDRNYAIWVVFQLQLVIVTDLLGVVIGHETDPFLFGSAIAQFAAAVIIPFLARCEKQGCS